MHSPMPYLFILEFCFVFLYASYYFPASIVHTGNIYGRENFNNGKIHKCIYVIRLTIYALWTTKVSMLLHTWVKINVSCIMLQETRFPFVLEMLTSKTLQRVSEQSQRDRREAIIIKLHFKIRFIELTAKKTRPPYTPLTTNTESKHFPFGTRQNGYKQESCKACEYT